MKSHLTFDQDPTTESHEKPRETVPRKTAIDFFDVSPHLSAQQSPFQRHLSSSSNLSHQSTTRRLKIQEEQRNLPIASHKSNILEKIEENACIILTGETGSGKSTQIPQFLLDAAFTKEGCIAITQPRRVAAINLAKRVAEELDVSLGKEVGYSIRFDDSSSKDTKIKYLTDGMLLIELLRDPLLSRYSTIILDEAHERTLLTDLLLGFTKLLLKKRLGLKVIVMSATLNAEQFSDFFEGAEILNVQGRTYPVEIMYTKVPQEDYLDSILRTVFQIHVHEPSGDILIFLTGSEEIEATASLLASYAPQLPRGTPKMLVCPFYASLPLSSQTRVFERTPSNARKIILSTNIAETSITVPGVRYVIDSGLVKSKTFDARTGFEILQVHPISKSNAVQRSGRAGRQAPGKCWRMYTQDTYDLLSPSPDPEIGRIALSAAVLTLKAHGVTDILQFPFFEAPNRESLVRALETLFSLSALDEKGVITTLGTKLARLPLVPQLARVLICAASYGPITKPGTDRDGLGLGNEVLDKTIDIIACLSVDGGAGGLFLDIPEKREEIMKVKERYISADGDHIMLLNVVRAYLDAFTQLGQSHAGINGLDRPLTNGLVGQNGDGSIVRVNGSDIGIEMNGNQGGKDKEAGAGVSNDKGKNEMMKIWCHQNFIDHRAMKAVLDTRRQLHQHVSRFPSLVPPTSSPTTTNMTTNTTTTPTTTNLPTHGKVLPHGTYETDTDTEPTDLILKSFLTGYIANTAFLTSDGSYRTTSHNNPVAIHPSSCLYGKKCEAIMFHESILTTRLYVRGVSRVRGIWVQEVAPLWSGRRAG